MTQDPLLVSQMGIRNLFHFQLLQRGHSHVDDMEGGDPTLEGPEGLMPWSSLTFTVGAMRSGLRALMSSRTDAGSNSKSFPFSCVVFVPTRTTQIVHEPQFLFGSTRARSHGACPPALGTEGAPFSQLFETDSSLSNASSLT